MLVFPLKGGGGRDRTELFPNNQPTTLLHIQKCHWGQKVKLAKDSRMLVPKFLSYDVLVKSEESLSVLLRCCSYSILLFFRWTWGLVWLGSYQHSPLAEHLGEVVVVDGEPAEQEFILVSWHSAL